jgi:hypothetical protein
MPNPRWYHAAGVGSDGKIYAFGGYVRTETVRRAYGVGDEALVIYDPRSATWERGPSVTKVGVRSRQKRSRGYVGDDGEVHQEFYEKETVGKGRVSHELITGVANPLGQPHWLSRYKWTRFDVDAGKWIGPPVLPLQVDNPDYARDKSPKGPQIWTEGAPDYYRYSGTLATAPNGLVYVTGGTGRPIDHPVERSEVLDVLESYNARTSEWKVLAPMRVRRDLHAAAVDRDGRLFENR